MRLVFAGTPAAAVPSLDALLKSRHEVAAVITRPDAPAGRGRRVGPSPVAERAAETGLEVLKPATPRDEGFLRRLRALAPECCPVTAYGALIPSAALEVPRHGWVNLHFSLLPAWRGAAPVPHAIAHGDDITGATTFRLVAELDAGPVYGVVTEPIGEQDTAGDLLARLAESGASLLVTTLDGIEARAIVESGEIIEPLRDRIVGRVTQEQLDDPFSRELVLEKNGEISEELASAIQDAGIEKVKIRSVLTCASRRGVCAKCYGRDLSTGWAFACCSGPRGGSPSRPKARRCWRAAGRF